MAANKAGDEHVYLYGHVPFKDYLRYMSGQPARDQAAAMKAWADDWRVAHERVEDLRVYEAGWADDPPIEPLPRSLRPLADKVWADPVFQRSFSAVPVEVGMVELDRLVVWQTLNNLNYVQRLKEQLGPRPAPEALFRFCLPYDHPVAEHRVSRVSDHSFSFISESTDLRFLEAVLLRPEQVVDYQSYGPIAGVIGLVVGFGSNYLNVIAAEGRVVLNNGYHRAYALRALGITQVPCLVQKVSTREELSYVASGGLRRHPDDYLKGARPPVLRDFFDPALTRTVLVKNNTRQVTVSYSSDELNIP